MILWPSRVNLKCWTRLRISFEQTCRAEPVQTRLLPFPDIKTNLAIGLQALHDEADEALAFLLTWSTGIAKLQQRYCFPEMQPQWQRFSPTISTTTPEPPYLLRQGLHVVSRPQRAW